MFEQRQVAGLAGQAAPAALPPELILPSVALLSFLLLGVVAVFWVSRWRKARGRRSWDADLDTYRTLYEQGQLSREELERIHARLAARLEGDSPPPVRPSSPLKPDEQDN
jgi:hypothetical protein